MKRLLIVLMFSAFSFAQNFTGIKICLNPGHGGYDSDDRFIPETGYWESVGNLDRGLALRNILQAHGATIVMTRVLNRSEDDLPLSQIVAIANQNNVDYFHSLHSNAFNGQSNYTLLLFRGYDNNPVHPQAKVMGSYMTEEIYKAHRTTNRYNRGDFDFYGNTSGLGVLRNLNMPGTLSEGAFHDYIPMSFRLRNLKVSKHEAWALSRAMIQYFGLTTYPHGIAAGIVRDISQNVPYYYISSQNDQKKPLNEINVTLMPGNKTYTGDIYNNGFYMFDSLSPGTYKVYFNVQNYFLDSSTVIVNANQSSFADKWLSLDTLQAPAIIQYSPSGPDSVNPAASIVIDFTRPMNISSVQSAFTILPNAAGNFSWSNDNKKLTFKPTSPLQGATVYNVTVGASALSIWNVPLGSDFNFSFVTKFRNKYSVENSYPAQNESNVSRTVQFRYQFDAPVLVSSVSGRVNLYNDSWTRITLKNAKIFSENDKGFIFFEPKDPLNRNATYMVVLGGGISDTTQLILGDSLVFTFKTTLEELVSGDIIEGFEDVSQWQDPDNNSTTTGTDTAYTKFLRVLDRKVTGSSSGSLQYRFINSSNGIIRLMHQTGFNITGEQTTEFGIWVFGDLSYHNLELWFTDGNQQLQIVPLGNINWTGWKLLRFPFSQVGGSGDKSLNSIVVKQQGTYLGQSSINFDDFQKDMVIGIDDKNEMNIIYDFSLSQNYPNPFNPITTIEFNLPSDRNISLKIFDILGREVLTLADGFFTKGNHKIKFEASNFSSGVYFYRLQSGSEFVVKKLQILQ